MRNIATWFLLLMAPLLFFAVVTMMLLMALDIVQEHYLKLAIDALLALANLVQLYRFWRELDRRFQISRARRRRLGF